MAAFTIPVRAEKPQYGGVLKIINPRSPRAPGWPSSGGGPGIEASLPAIERLVGMDIKGLPRPVLATSWEYADDLSSLTFTLRKGVKFHDGEDFNAEVAKMNLEERIKNGLVAKPLRIIGSIDIVDDYTIRLNLKEFRNNLLDTLAGWNGLIISPKVIEKAKIKKGKKWAQKNPVGTGPFKFVKFERKVILKFEKFDGYWDKGKPYLDGIEMHYITDPMTSVISL
jgi:ABC-type transport system substrate-binding protein